MHVSVHVIRLVIIDKVKHVAKVSKTTSGRGKYFQN